MNGGFGGEGGVAERGRCGRGDAGNDRLNKGGKEEGR